MHRQEAVGVIRRFFAGLTEYAFCSCLGVADPPLVDYVAKMLTRFARSDQIYKVRSPAGKRLDQVVDMLQEAQSRQGSARREVHRHIGDYTLFWSGIYPEAIEKLGKLGWKDGLIDYRVQGKQAYHIASTIPTDREDARSDVLGRLSQEFELCVYGLGEVRREWERREGPGNVAPLWIN